MSDIDELLKLAEEGQAETRELTDIEKFFQRFEVTPSETTITPFWAIYRCYRLSEEKPLGKTKFRGILSKYFRKADKTGKYRYISYFCNPGKLDLSDAGRKAEEEFERANYLRKKRQEKERNKDKPWVKYRNLKLWKRYKAGEIE